MQFVKYEGTGNDFVVLQGDAALAFDPRHAAAVCDRHFGVGADGVLLVLPPESPGAVARMRVINADGSEPEMCGNGLRCVALAVAESRGAERAVELLLDTGAGPKLCRVERRERGAEVSVDMGAVRWVERRTLELDGEAITVDVVDAGNPHAILFGDFDAAERARLGPRIETHASFPRRTNVEFARIVDSGHLELVVWERGVGFTLACGTGACATAVAAWHAGVVTADPLEVRLPGGALRIGRIQESIGMRGPARRVFSGRLDPA